jgi:hypothetical protein
METQPTTSEATPATRNYQTDLTTAQAFAMVRTLREAGFLVLCLTPGDLMELHDQRVADAIADGNESTMPKHHREPMTYQEAAEALRDEEDAISGWTEWSNDTLNSALDTAMLARDESKGGCK